MPSDRSPLVSAEDALGRLGDAGLRLADVRWYLGAQDRGREEYAQGHIPGAIFVDLERDLSAPDGPGRHPLPEPVGFARRLAALGFGSDHAIVVYDDASGSVAARLWWMLDRLGHPDVTVLDGGLTAWRALGGPLTAEVPRYQPARLHLASSWSGIIEREELAARLGSLDLVDLRAEERYRGEVEPVDRVPGHIPSARSVPASELLGPDARLMPAGELRALFSEGSPGAPASDAGSSPTVVSCGSGVTACLGALAARVAGLPDPILYPGSYSDWTASGMPVESGRSLGRGPAPLSREPDRG